MVVTNMGENKLFKLSELLSNNFTFAWLVVGWCNSWGCHGVVLKTSEKVKNPANPLFC